MRSRSEGNAPRKRASHLIPTSLQKDLQSLDGDSISMILLHLPLHEILKFSLLNKNSHQFIFENEYLWSKLGTLFGMKFDFVTNPLFSSFQHFKLRFQSWCSYYGTNSVVETPYINMHQNITNQQSLQEIHNVSSDVVFRDFYERSWNQNVYLMNTFGDLYTLNDNLTLLYSNPNLRDFDMVDVFEKYQIVLCLNDQVLCIVNFVGKVICQFANVLDFFIHQQGLSMIRFIHGDFVYERYDLNLKSLVFSKHVAKLQTSDFLNRLLQSNVVSNQIVDASICYEDTKVLIVCQGKVYLYIKDDLASTWPLAHKTGLQGIKWITPVARSALYNGTLVYRSAEKSIGQDNVVWTNPMIHQVQLSTQQDTVCKEDNRETKSLWWNLCCKLGKVIVHDMEYISCYDLKQNALNWSRIDCDYTKLLDNLEGQEETCVSSCLGSEICGNFLIAHFSRDGDHSGAIYNIENGKTVSLINISRNFKRVIARGVLKTFDYLEFERVNDIML